MSSALFAEDAGLLDDLRSELGALEALVQRRRWRVDPCAWAAERAKNFLWSKQKEIMLSLRDHRRTAVKSCHGPGKSFTAAEAVCWWLDAFPAGEAGAVTTAPTDRQVQFVLWKEIRRVHAAAELPGRTNQKAWLMDVQEGRGLVELTVAFGMKPDDYNPTAFQGIHFRRMLVVYDEACGIPGSIAEAGTHTQSLWDAGDSLLSNDDCRALAIGNPDDPTAEFARICKPGSGWNVITISAFDTPNFTGERIPERLRPYLVGRTWVEEKRKAWAPAWTWTADGSACIPPADARVEDAHPLWLSKVLGIFPESAEDQGLLPITWVEAAAERVLDPGSPVEMGVDVGGGGDTSTSGLRRGFVFRILSEDRNPDTMQTCGKVVAERRSSSAEVAKVDVIGIGRGLVDRGKELGEPFVGINVAESPTCNCLELRFRHKRKAPAAVDPRSPSHYDDCNVERFLNLRAQAWWEVRDLFEAKTIDIDPNDQILSSELCAIRFKRTSAGKIQIESKDEAKRRGVGSPNRADALMLAFLRASPPSRPKARSVF